MLDGLPSLSARYRSRHAIVLAHLEPGASAEQVSEARTVLRTAGPRAAARLLAGAPAPLALDRDPGSSPTVHGSGQLALLVRELVRERPGLTAYLSEQSPLEQTAVPLHPSREAHLVRIGDREAVALRWSAGSVRTRLDNAERLAGLVATLAAPLPISVQRDQVIVQIEGEDPWVFAPNLGRTLEDRFRDRDLSALDRGRVIASLAALRDAMLREDLIWQGFAPRNMFLRDDRLILIDFEEVLDTVSDQARAVECLHWHRIFFADCLTDSEQDVVFAVPAPTLADEYELEADAFERSLLGVGMVPWQQRRQLLTASARLEGRHTRPDGRPLFGHELGHFWGDFLSRAIEARLFTVLRRCDDSATLGACLEVFEAAMEADICSSLTRHVHGTDTDYAARTALLVEAVESAGIERLAQLREVTEDWYGQLATDPARLTDEITHAACAGPLGPDPASLDTFLVGTAESRKAHEESLATAVSIGLDFAHRRSEPFLHYRTPDELRELAAAPLPTHGTDLDRLLTEVDSQIARYAIAQAHPRYLAFPDTGNSVAALIGGVLGRLLNQNLIAVDRSAPSATFIEIQVIEWLRELVGYATAPITQLRGVRDVAGLWTTGGHLSNHVAMLVALGHRFPSVRRHGLPGLPTQPAIVMAGSIAHYSHGDAAFHLGLGWDSVLTADTKPGYTTDPAAVEALLTDPPEGKTPFMVVGVAGNCRTTGLDDLSTLAEVCRRHGVWFHVDACHGGSLLFSDRLRARHLAGIEQADSVSLDPHKGLFSPYPSSYVVFRDRGVLTQFSRHEATVMADGCWDLGLITPFLGSRGYESLATWMLLRHIGVRRLGELVEGRQAHVRYLEQRIAESGLFTALNDVDFYRLAFVLCPPRLAARIRRLPPERQGNAARTVSRYTSRLNTTLYQAGSVCFDEHTLADLADRVGAGTSPSYTVMAACPGNPLLTRADLDAALDELFTAARILVPALTADVLTDAPASTHAPRTGGPAGWSDAP